MKMKMKAAAVMKMKSMKMKAAAMKAMKMKVKKVSKVGKKWQVFKGTRVKSKGGLKKEDLTKNKNGKVVSKKLSARGKKHPWMAACAKARKTLGIKGFAVVGGKTSQGQALLRKAKSFYKA